MFTNVMQRGTPLDYCINNDYFDHCGSAIQSYVDALGFLIAKNMTSYTLSSYDNAMEMIFLYKILPYLSVDNKTISLVKEMFGYNFLLLSPECVKISPAVTHCNYAGKARNEAEKEIIHNKNSLEMLKKSIMSRLNPALRSNMSLPLLQESAFHTPSCI